MKRTLLFILALSESFSMWSQVSLSDALKSPAKATSVILEGKNDAASMAGKASRFTSLNEVIVRNVNDSIELEQDLIALTGISSLRRLVIENCGVNNISPGINALIQVSEVSINSCDKLDVNNLFATLSGMRGLQELDVSFKSMSAVPRSLGQLKGLKSISIINNDLSYADAYELNTSDVEDLMETDSLVLGFGNETLQLNYSCMDAGYATQHITVLRDVLQGVAFAGNEYRLPGRPVIFNKQHPLVKPPIDGLDVLKSIYEVNATTGGEIEYPSGTTFTIPVNAFVDKNGNKVDGSVAIDYREFRDPVDIMVSGIPMDYDSGGTKGHFVSAGMFEMNASANGEEVFLAPGKDVAMNFAVVDTGSNFNFYRLDETNGWQYQSSPGKAEDPAADALSDSLLTLTPPSAAILYFYNNIRGVNSKKPGEFDPTSFDDRYFDLEYDYDVKMKKVKNKTAYGKLHSHFKLTKSYHHKDTTCFSIERLGHFNYNDPELRSFAGYEWMTTDKVRSAELKTLFRKKSLINDIRVFEDGNGFILEFKTFTGFKRINVVPVRMHKGKPLEVKSKTISRMFRSYTRTLTKRRGYMDRKIARAEKRETHWKEWAEADSIKVWKNSISSMTDDETGYDFRGWVDYYRAEFPKLMVFNRGSFSYAQTGNMKMTVGEVQSGMLVQALTISSFGIYNCDHCDDIKSPVHVKAILQAIGGVIINAINIYVLDRDVNTSTTYSSGGGSSVEITYSKPAVNSLVGIDRKGALYYVSSTAFTNGEQSGGNTRYPATLISQKPATPEQLRDIIFDQQE